MCSPVFRERWGRADVRCPQLSFFFRLLLPPPLLPAAGQVCWDGTERQHFSDHVPSPITKGGAMARPWLPPTVSNIQSCVELFWCRHPPLLSQFVLPNFAFFYASFPYTIPPFPGSGKISHRCFAACLCFSSFYFSGVFPFVSRFSFIVLKLYPRKIGPCWPLVLSFPWVSLFRKVSFELEPPCFSPFSLLRRLISSLQYCFAPPLLNTGAWPIAV